MMDMVPQRYKDLDLASISHSTASVLLEQNDQPGIRPSRRMFFSREIPRPETSNTHLIQELLDDMVTRALSSSAL